MDQTSGYDIRLLGQLATALLSVCTSRLAVPWLRVDFPLEKLNGQLDFVVEILSALDLSGHSCSVCAWSRHASTAGANNELKKGRQVTNWITTLTIGTEDHAAWMKVVGA